MRQKKKRGQDVVLPRRGGRGKKGSKEWRKKKKKKKKVSRGKRVTMEI